MSPDDLKEWRARLGLSQAGMAEALRLSKRTYEAWEQGRFAIPAYLELALCELERRLKRKGKKR
jgi:DNA-binding XRE family transcriptional regulator